VDWVAVEWSRALWHDNAAVRDMLGPVIFYGISQKSGVAIGWDYRLLVPALRSSISRARQQSAPEAGILARDCS
jgi:hypothetical protein